MATPFDVQLDELPAGERAEILKLLGERSREVWYSDEGDGLAFHLLFGLAALGGVIAGLTMIPVEDLLDFWTYLPGSLTSPSSLMVLGFLLAILSIPLVLWRFFVLHKRHGWLLTSFGYVRVRGPDLRLVRWQDITRVQRRVIGSGRGKFAMVDLTTPNGTLESDTSYFFNDIKRRVPQSATVAE
jgi:hypothetical protein